MNTKEILRNTLITESEINKMSYLDKRCAELFNNSVKDSIRIYKEFIEGDFNE